jgi:TfoX/Sxy family transcriptional regulator of competence genes
MPYNEAIDSRIKQIVSKWENTNVKKMFGGTCHLLNGNMVCGVYKDDLILRLGEDDEAKAMKTPYARPFDITGKAMKGWIMVKQEGFKTNKELEDWLNLAKKFVATLPSK